MTCEYYRSAMIDYRYDELKETEAQDVAEHLRTCSDCARAYCALDADLKGFGEAFEARPRTEVYARLAERVRAAFPEPLSARIARLIAFPIPLYQVALVALVAVAIGVLALNDGTSPPTSTENPTLIESYDADVLLSVPNRVL